MATYVITTPVNIDSLALKTGSDTYTINGGYLTVDQDTRYGTNQNVSAAMGNIALSATLGGIVEIDSRLVRIIPYNTGSGLVPAYGTVISQGGASGLLLTVMATLGSTPVAPGGAMPASGFVKIRQWNSTPYAAGALTGISATATGPDRAGWLEIVGVDALACTVNRLNTFRVRGDFFDLGTTTGTRATTYQIPSNGSIVYLPGVEVETAPGSGIFGWYPCAGSALATAAVFATDEVRGRVCWISTAGLLRFGHDGTNSTGGFIPAAGRQIRIPNVFLFCCTAAALTANVLPNATLATRYEFATAGGGVVDIDKACVGWHLNCAQPFSVELSHVGVLSQIILSECSSPISWDYVCVGQEAANSQFALNMALCFFGGTLDNCVWTRANVTASGHYVNNIADISGFTFTGNRLHSYEDVRGNAATGAQSITRMSASDMVACTFIGGRTLLTTCDNCRFEDIIYADATVNTTVATIPMYAFDLVSSCLNLTFDGLSFGGLTLVQPYSGILQIGAAGCKGIKVRNLGTSAAPLDLGGARRDVVSWSRVTTVATVTSVAHGLKVGDIIYVPVSRDIAAIVVGAKTIASVPTADTFTFTCLNAGAASQTLSYYPVMAGVLFALAAGAAADDVEVKRCYVPHTRTNLFTSDNSSKNLRLENVYADMVSPFLVPHLNGTLRAVGGAPLLTAQSACYGTHWFANFMADVTPNTVGVSWARTTTTCTVTSANHGLRTGLVVNVTACNDELAVPFGQKTVTVLDGNTFTFVCLNAGATSGTLSFSSFLGRVGVQMNEPTTDTAAQVTFDAGTPAFTSTGGLYMPTIGQQVTFEHPDFALGHTNFEIAEPVMGTASIDNFDLFYAIDKNDGAGFSAFRNLRYRRTGGGGASASTNVTMADTTGVLAGNYVFGTNIAGNARVVSITNATTVVVDRPNIGVVSGTLRFCALPGETGIDASKGFKLRLRVLTTVTNTTAMTFLYVFTNSTVVSRAFEFPLDLFAFELTGLVAGSSVFIYDAANPTVLIDSEVVAGSTFQTTVDPVTYPAVNLVISKTDYYTQRFTGISMTGGNVSRPVLQVADLQYAA